MTLATSIRPNYIFKNETYIKNRSAVMVLQNLHPPYLHVLKILKRVSSHDPAGPFNVRPKMYNCKDVTRRAATDGPNPSPYHVLSIPRVAGLEPSRPMWPARLPGALTPTQTATPNNIVVTQQSVTNSAPC